MDRYFIHPLPGKFKCPVQCVKKKSQKAFCNGSCIVASLRYDSMTLCYKYLVGRNDRTSYRSQIRRCTFWNDDSTSSGRKAVEGQEVHIPVLWSKSRFRAEWRDFLWFIGHFLLSFSFLFLLRANLIWASSFRQGQANKQINNRRKKNSKINNLNCRFQILELFCSGHHATEICGITFSLLSCWNVFKVSVAAVTFGSKQFPPQ